MPIWLHRSSWFERFNYLTSNGTQSSLQTVSNFLLLLSSQRQQGSPPGSPCRMIRTKHQDPSTDLIPSGFPKELSQMKGCASTVSRPFDVAKLSTQDYPLCLLRDQAAIV